MARGLRTSLFSRMTQPSSSLAGPILAPEFFACAGIFSGGLLESVAFPSAQQNADPYRILPANFSATRSRHSGIVDDIRRSGVTTVRGIADELQTVAYGPLGRHVARRVAGYRLGTVLSHYSSLIYLQV